MILYTSQSLKDVTTGSYAKKKQKPVSDTIYTFDIETTSLFEYQKEVINNEGIFIEEKFDVFNYDLPKEYYSTCRKLAIPYIWQFGIEDTVYYGRDFMEFEHVLKQISDPVLTKVIWIQNLSFEFGFLPNILKNYTVEKMLARDVRKPISFLVKELNIMFRCSYMLTNLSLATAAKEYTSIEKLDTLDYTSKVRTPLTTLTDQELAYCEYDCLCLYHIIKDHYLPEYEHICLIPSTATGEIRRELKKNLDFYHFKKMWDLVPNPKLYLKMMACFQGGYTHANVLNAGRIFRKSEGYNIPSWDIASSYPYQMLQPLPATEFLHITENHYHKLKNNERYCFIMRIQLFNAKSKYYNHYISSSRCIASEGVIYDNGRIQEATFIDTWCTSIDLDIIQKAYKFDRIEYKEIYMSKLKYLDKRIIRFILSLYSNKTTLKGVEEKTAIYKKSKQYINSLYGCSVTNPLKNSAEYVNGQWCKKEFTMEFVKEVLDETSHSFSTLFYYPQGLFITSGARAALFNRLISDPEFDRHVIYCDTDSVKYYGDYDHIFEEYNKQVIDSYKKLIEVYPEFTIDDFMPIDSKGNKRPIGVFEKEIDSYEEFITLGAKKYCYREDGKLHITVSGVSKEGVTALDDNIENFQKGFTFDYNSSHKLQHTYLEEMPHVTVIDQEGNSYKNELDYGIVLQPTTYTLGITEVYESLINYYNEMELRRKWKNLNRK